jgi:predicted phage tail protein
MADLVIRGAGGPKTPTEAKDTLDSQGYLRLVDVLCEGEIQGPATPEKKGISKNSPAYSIEGYKDIFVENTPVLRSAAVVKTGTYTQTSTVITVNCTGHGYVSDTEVRLFPSTGLATTDNYKITSTTSNSFTCDSKNTNVTSGSLAIAIPGDFNFTQFEVTSLYGTPTQTLPASFNAVESEISVGTKVEFSVPLVRTITNTEINATRITINIPALQQTTSKGDIVGTTLELAIDISENGGGFYTVIQDKIEGRSGDLYQKDYEVQLIGKTFPIDIRVRRITPDSTSSKLTDEFTWFSYVEINYTRLSYPNTALVAGRIAAEQFSNIPSRSYQIRGRKIAIPSNATVELSTGRLIYSGTWDGTFGAAQWTSDPAWCMWNLLTDYRAGFGDHLSASVLDKWAFYSASQYCSGLVPTGLTTSGSTSLIPPVLTGDKAYSTISGVSSNLLSLDIYHFGTGLLENRPVVIYIHGGAWALGDKANIDSKASFYNNLGYIFISINYRLSPSQIIPYSSFSASRVKHPNHIADCAAAIRWIYDNIGNYGGNQTKLVLSGHSAGAHLASLLATNQSYLSTAGVAISNIKGCISVDTEGYDIYKQIATPVDGGESSLAQQKLFYQNAFGIYPDATISGAGTVLTTDYPNTATALAAYTAASPVSNVSATTPPFLVLMRGVAARITRETEFVTALQAAAVSYTSVSYPDSTTYTHSEINTSIGSVNDPPVGKTLPSGTANVSTQIQNWLTSIVPTTAPPTTATTQYEPRFSCNVSIQTREEAYKLISDFSSVFRVMPYWSAGALTISADKPKDPTFLFNRSNVTESGFTYQNSSQKIRPTVAIVSYLDLETRELGYEQVEDADGIAKYGMVTTEVAAFACTSRSQANRIGRWILYSEKYEAETINFTTSVDAGVVVRPGQVIAVSDPVRAGARRGGRISSATTTAITVDNAAGLNLTNTPTLSVILSDGSTQTRNVSSISGNTITVSSAFTTAPNPNSIWIYESSDLKTSLWRIISVEETDRTNYIINALKYDPSKFAYIEAGEALEPRDVTNLTLIVDPPTSVAYTEALYLYQSQVRSKIILSWPAVSNVAEYQVKWRKDSGNWQSAISGSADYEILDITPGAFNIEIYSLNATAKPSTTAAKISFAALGKTAPPSNVVTFTAALDPIVGVTLNWNPVTDLDIQGYEIWQGSAFGSGTKIGVFAATSKKLGLIAAGSTQWWIKALDTSGSYSTTAISASLTITGATAPTISGVFSNDSLVLNWTAVVGSLNTAAYEVRYGTVASTWASATPIGTVQGTTMTIKGAWVDTRRFFIAAIDLNGNYGTAATYDGVITAPSQPTITQQVVDNNVLLQWTDSTQTLPILYYELRRGTTFTGATVIGTKQGKFTTVFETVSGAFTYWLVGVDSAGNVGAPGSVSAQVNQPPDYVLKLNVNSTFTGTKTNLAAIDVGLLASVDTTETWQSHFTSRSWTTPQDQINAGYPIYALPSQTSGQYFEDIDYGAIVAGSKVSTTLTANLITGSKTITPSISVRGTTSTAGTYSQTTTTITVTSTAHGLSAGALVYLDFTTGTATDGSYVVATAATNTFTVTSTTSTTTSGNVSWIKWTVYPGVDSVFATNFRFIRAQYDFASAGGDDLLQITALNIRLDSKLKNDSGAGTANSADSGGTTVTFNTAFVDVDSISVTAAGTTAVIAIYDFVDVANPTSFKVLLYDTSGVRVSGAFSWSARGF